MINTETGVKVENITYEHFQVIKKLKVYSNGNYKIITMDTATGGTKTYTNFDEIIWMVTISGLK